VTDEDVARLLRSDLPFVTIEAPAGCGKTHQGALFATDAASRLEVGRVLILTHTHAARSVFASRTRAVSGRVEIRTIDSFLTEIASIYHRALDLPFDVGTWARENNRYDVVASRCRRLLEASLLVAEATARRYPIIVCDEHQDASADQHHAVMAIHAAGASVRVFGDPMQVIFADGDADIRATLRRWDELKALGGWGELSTPHRWSSGSPELGEWVLEARRVLQDGGVVNLAGHLPKGLSIHFAENSANVPHKALSMTKEHRAPVNALMRRNDQLLVLTVGNDRVAHLNAFFGRSMRIWEGHTREHLSALNTCVRKHAGDIDAIADGFLAFVFATGTRFSPSTHGARLKAEVEQRCSKPARGMPAHLQTIARFLIAEPDHRGIARALAQLVDLVDRKEAGFNEVEFDLRSEIRDAIRIGDFHSVDEGFAEITRRRTFSHPQPPRRCLSTIHKSKGLECDNALMLMCDRPSFSGTAYKRRLFYVGMSRAKKTLALVLSRDNSTPLLRV
jgi:DNA helicase-2/ATP-dependent DNA helicase PcrA